jgi:SAM-dependent methyltransferase
VKRAFDPNEPEWMDRPQPVSAALETGLRNIASMNRWFGSRRVLKKFLSRWLDAPGVYRILDLATGSADLPRAMVLWARPRGIKLRIDAVDVNDATIEIARRECREFAEIDFIRADALTFHSPTTYDFVHCSLALHHFSEEDAAMLLRRCRGLSHRFVLVTDLERSVFTTISARMLSAFIYRAPMTRFDAVLSARRAFSFREFHDLADAAGWSDFGHGRFLFCRQALWLDMYDAGDIPLADSVPCPT